MCIPIRHKSQWVEKIPEDPSYFHVPYNPIFEVDLIIFKEVFFSENQPYSRAASNQERVMMARAQYVPLF